MKWLKLLGSKLFGEYALYRIYSIPADDCAEPEPGDCSLRPIENMQEISGAEDGRIRCQISYAGDEAFCFGAWIGGQLAAACWFWAGKRYKVRNFWPLGSKEAKLVQVVTAERFRGRGLAPKLISYAGGEMGKKGYSRLYARIWHSNRSSIAAFHKAGWKYIAFVVELFPLGIRKPLRFVFRKKNLS